MRRRSQSKAGVWSDQRWIVSESGPGQIQSVGGVPDKWIDLGFHWWSGLRCRRWSQDNEFNFKARGRRNRHWSVREPAPRHRRMFS